MARSKIQKKRHVGYFALVKGDKIIETVHNENGLLTKKYVTVRKYRRVGFAEATKQRAYDEARKHYGAHAQIIVEGSRIDVRPMYIGMGGVVCYGDYKPGPKEVDYSCFSSRSGRL